MRITNEADYALRIVYSLMGCRQKNAKTIAEDSGVTLRFALKILRKLVLSGIVGSQQGAAGGYFLKKKPSEISVGEIVEMIDGPFKLNNCMDSAFVCSRIGCDLNSCQFHRFFVELNQQIIDTMYSKTFDQFIPQINNAVVQSASADDTASDK